MTKKLDSIIKDVLGDFNPKQRRVIIDRFGLSSGRPATLQEIGDKLGITRERVRQIEEKVLSKVKPKLNEKADSILSFGRIYLAKVGGIREDKAFLKDFILYFNEETKHAAQKMKFIFLAAGVPSYHKEDDDFQGFWYLKESDKEKFSSFVVNLVRFIKNSDKKSILETKNYFSRLDSLASFHTVSISKKFGFNRFGDFGFKEWPEIEPRTIRDKIYLVLKKTSQPLHFENIAHNINRFGFDEKRAHPQTVHNELIKDNRFVLVGRGMYALREHGYEPGTVREVIVSLLKKHGPLSRQKLMELMNQKRFFKEQTILVNLQNRRYFKRLDDGRYHVKEA